MIWTTLFSIYMVTLFFCWRNICFWWIWYFISFIVFSFIILGFIIISLFSFSFNNFSFIIITKSCNWIRYGVNSFNKNTTWTILNFDIIFDKFTYKNIFPFYILLIHYHLYILYNWKVLLHLLSDKLPQCNFLLYCWISYNN